MSAVRRLERSSPFAGCSACALMAAAVGVLFLVTVSAVGSDVPSVGAPSASERDLTIAKLIRTLTLRDYNTRVVVLGVTCLGMAAGVIGSFAYLRKRAMLGDALSHATLPGIALVFLLTGEKNIALLLLGATVTGVLGVLCALALRRVPRIREDAAIGIVLSVFFGIGMVLFSIVQEMSTGNQAGLQGFIYGKAAAMVRSDAVLLAAAAGVVVAGAMLLFKEFRLVCFDQEFAAAQGWPVLLVDLLMMGLVVVTTVVGLQAVGLILVVALLIIPAAAARFWTDRLTTMIVLAGVFGAASGWLGATLSALAGRLPAGAIIVICTGVVFLLSMLFAPHRGVVAGLIRQLALRRRTVFQHLLRALAELEEGRGEGCAASINELLTRRRWTRVTLLRLILRARRAGLLVRGTERRFKLTGAGRIEAQRILRNHRLWEMYLIRYADVAPSHVDRDADEIEHVLPESIVRELERAVAEEAIIPPSPHPVGVTT